MEAKFQLGVGIRFKPTDEELIKCFLLKRVKGQVLSPSPIVECELYGKRSPWEIFEERANYSDRSIWYCFTSLKMTSKKKISRVAGNGTWHGESSAKQIVDSKKKNVVIGFKKTFTFKIKGKNSNWNMHEFRLADDGESSNYVLCKIKKTKPKAVEEEVKEMASELATTNTINNFAAESHQSCSQLFVPPTSLNVCDDINVGEQCYGMENLPNQVEIISNNGLRPPLSETTIEKATNIIDDDDWSAVLEQYLQQEKSPSSYN